MVTTNFPIRARRNDPNGHMVVQQMVEFLRDLFDALSAKFAQGSATITVGNVAVTVIHNLGASTYSVAITPLTNPGALVWWVSGKTSTQFVINLSGAAPVGGVQFDWIAKGG